MLRALQAAQPDTSVDSADALCQRAHSSSHGKAWRPNSSGYCSVSAAGAGGATELHCSASSCCSDAAAAQDGARKHRQAAASSASLPSTDEDDGRSSMGAPGRNVGFPSTWRTTQGLIDIDMQTRM